MESTIKSGLAPMPDTPNTTEQKSPSLKSMGIRCLCVLALSLVVTGCSEDVDHIPPNFAVDSERLMERLAKLIAGHWTGAKRLF